MSMLESAVSTLRSLLGRLLGALLPAGPARPVVGDGMANRTRASSLARELFGATPGLDLNTMESPERVEAFREDLLSRYPWTEQAKKDIRAARMEILDLSREWGGGFWVPEHWAVLLRGSQYEAALHECAHLCWENLRKDRAVREGLVDAVRRLADERDPRYRRAQEIAHHYRYGIKSQPDPSSPTGYWRGMMPEGEEPIDWECFAGLSSAVMGDMRLLPPYTRKYFASVFVSPPAGPDEPT